MERFRDFSGLAVPYVRENIDTDQIIPKQFLRSIKKTGYGLFLFNDDRWLETASDSSTTRDQLRPNPDFILNAQRYQGAQILIAGKNFGCGSSREHAVWALADYGFRTIIAPSFADIFAGNASKNGLLLITQPPEVIETLQVACEAEPGFMIAVNLSASKPYIEAAGQSHPFTIDPGAKERLLAGLDEIGITEQMLDRIKDYEANRLKQEPWLDLDTTKHPS